MHQTSACYCQLQSRSQSHLWSTHVSGEKWAMTLSSGAWKVFKADVVLKVVYGCAHSHQTTPPMTTFYAREKSNVDLVKAKKKKEVNMPGLAHVVSAWSLVHLYWYIGYFVYISGLYCPICPLLGPWPAAPLSG